MKLIMTLLVRDEEDILRTHLDYHLRAGVDHIIITDNNSVDGTPDIIEEYVSDGHATLIREPADDYSQGVWVTRMARMAFTHFGADWVIHSDADEFWWPPHLPECFARVPVEYDTVIVKRSNFLPMRAGPAPFWRAMTVRETVSLNACGLPLPGKVAHRAVPDAEVEQGNHGVGGPGLGNIVPSTEQIIFHFPLRSRNQLRNKIVKGGAAYERNTSLKPEQGSTWRHLWELEKSGSLSEWYESQPHGDDQNVALKIQQGELSRDLRLFHFLSTLI